MSTPQIPTGDTVIALLNPQGTQSQATHTFRRNAFKAITHVQRALSEPTHTYGRCSGQHTPTVGMIQPIHSHKITVKTNTYCGGHCHSNAYLLESLSQSTHHLGYPSSELHTKQVSRSPDTNRELYCNQSPLPHTHLYKP